MAGAFTGVHNDALIVAGGANFPEGLPWEINSTGVVPPKIYHDDIFVLQQIEGDWKWTVSQTKHPGSWAYGASVSHPKFGLICIGGETKLPPVDGKQERLLSREVFALQFKGNELVVDRGFPLCLVASLDAWQLLLGK